MCVRVAELPRGTAPAHSDASFLSTRPLPRRYSYFSMQLRFGWSPINHMGKNPCMQRALRSLLRAKEARVAAGAAGAGSLGPNGTAVFTSEEIMMTNLQCVRPCYANNASGVGAAALAETWHDEAKSECRNIYFTPLVHSMCALLSFAGRRADTSACSAAAARPMLTDCVPSPLRLAGTRCTCAGGSRPSRGQACCSSASTIWCCALSPRCKPSPPSWASRIFSRASRSRSGAKTTPRSPGCCSRALSRAHRSGYFRTFLRRTTPRSAPCLTVDRSGS